MSVHPASSDKAAAVATPALKRFFAHFQKTYLSVDCRILGVFRILFGGVLLYDLIRRSFDCALLYSNDGVLSNHFLLFAPQAEPQFSLFFAFSTAAEARLAFLLAGLVYVLYILGWATKPIQVLTLLVVSSLNSRNLVTEDGGVCTCILLAMWTLWLPVGNCYSLDALLKDARLRTIGERVARRRSSKATVSSLANLAIALQIAAIYWLNAIHKSGNTWKSGDAVHYVLWQNRVTTPLGIWLAQHEPLWFSPVATYGTLVLEYALPVLVLLPVFTKVLRTLAFFLAVALHGGIALLMTLGPFSYAMIALVSLRLPGESLERAGAWLPAKVRRRARSLHGRLIRKLRGWFSKRAATGTALADEHLIRVRSATPGVVASLRRLRLIAREACISILMLAATIQMTRSNRAFPAKWRLPQPSALAAIIMYPRLLQAWSMFAPDAPTNDGTVVIDATTRDGRKVDPLTGKAPDFDVLLNGAAPHSIALSDYFLAVLLDEKTRYRREFEGYLKRWHELDGRGPADKLESYAIYWVSYDTPPRGSTTRSNAQRKLLFKSRNSASSASP